MQSRSDSNFLQNAYVEEHSNGDNGAGEEHVAMLIEEESSEAAAQYVDEFSVALASKPEVGEHLNALPFLVHKESGPLDPDLMVQFNTSDLLNNTVFETGRPPTGILPEQIVAARNKTTSSALSSLI